MTVDLAAIDTSQFMVHEHVVNGEILYLVQPQHIGCRWDQNNKIFRSSLWNSDGLPISLSFPKFTNWGENPEHFPLPTSLKNCHAVEKVDGSLLIVSQYKGNRILRTRGTVDATKLDNGHELELFREKFDKSLTHDMPDTWSTSLLFEWVSPVNRIILNYGDQPDWYFVGMVNHEDYSLYDQPSLDIWAKNHGFKRPESYHFSSIEALLADVEQWKGKEGVVIYSPDGMHKVKGDWYRNLHAAKENFRNIEAVIDVWFTFGQPAYTDFITQLSEHYDYETMLICQGYVSRICDAAKEVEKIILGMNVFIRDVLVPLPSRKEQALKVISAYGNTNRASFVFSLLSGKQLTDEQRKKLLFQCLKSDR